MAEQHTCAVHHDRPATYRCDGCGKTLCGDCVQMSHRLILCSQCGELAIPLATGRVTTSTEARRKQAIERPYSLAQAFLYPVRGEGSGVFWSYVALMVIFAIPPLLIPLTGCLLLIPEILIALLIPRLLFTIVRETADGDDELPDWPEFDFWARLGDAMTFVAIIVVSCLPAWALFSLTDCAGFGLLTIPGEPVPQGPSCWPPLIFGFFLSVLLWIPIFGAPSVFDSLWLLPRLDLHARALLVAPIEAGFISLLLASLLVLGYFLAFGFASIPLIGGAVAVGLLVYTLFTGAHLVGVYFRRHNQRLERLYLG